MPKFSIIIPVCGQPEITRECLNRLVDYSADYELIIVDNQGDFIPDVSCKIIRNDHNLGFPKAINQGLEVATGEIIILLNNDVLVTPNWLEFFEYHLKNADIVGPKTNQISGPQKIEGEIKNDFDVINNLANSLHEKNEGQFRAYHRIVFFCVALKKSVIEKIGLLDEQFTPGNFEDDDYCLRAVQAGFRLVIAEDVFVYHYGSMTHKSLNLDKEKLIASNVSKFQLKWPEAIYKELQTQAIRNFSNNLLNPNSPLSLVMIVKNEEKGLERAILSCQGLISNIVIAIDNNTTDNTEAVAKKYANVIKHFDFKDDYSAARNFAQEGVNTPWTLFLDGHEFVKNAPYLFEALKKDCDGLLCTIEMENNSQFRNPRIFKSTVRFKGAIHEQQQCDKIALYPQFIVKHDRTNGQNPEAIQEREEQRNRQMPEIMGKMLSENPKDTLASFHLFLHYAGRNEIRQAKQYAKKFLRHSVSSSERWLVYFDLSLAYIMKRRYLKAYLNATAAEREIPNRWEIKKIIGIILFYQKNYIRALDYFVNSLSPNSQDYAFKPWDIDSTQTWNYIGECFFNISEFWKAEQSFNRAAELATDNGFKITLHERATLMHDIAVEKK